MFTPPNHVIVRVEDLKIVHKPLLSFSPSPNGPLVGRSRLQFGTELALCQWYYEKSYDYNVVPGTVRWQGLLSWSIITSNRPVYSVLYSVQKRTTPSIVYYHPNTGVANSAWNADASTAGTCTLYLPNDKSFQIYWNSANSGQTQGQVIYIHYTCDADY